MYHASNSRLANTTETRRCGSTSRARRSVSAPNSAGQSSSASSTINTHPSSPDFAAASCRCLAKSSFWRRNRSRFTRIGSGICTAAAGVRHSMKRRSKTGNAATSPCPSTMATSDDGDELHQFVVENNGAVADRSSDSTSGTSWPSRSSSPAENKCLRIVSLDALSTAAIFVSQASVTTASSCPG